MKLKHKVKPRKTLTVHKCVKVCAWFFMFSYVKLKDEVKGNAELAIMCIMVVENLTALSSVNPHSEVQFSTF